MWSLGDWSEDYSIDSGDISCGPPTTLWWCGRFTYLQLWCCPTKCIYIYIYDSICIYDILSVIKFMYEPCSCFFSGYHVKLVRDNAGPAFGSYHDPLFVWNPGQILSPVRHCCRMEDLASFRLDFAGIATWPMPRGEAWPMDKWWLNQENMVIEHEHYTNRNEGGRMEGWSRWMRRI